MRRLLTRIAFVALVSLLAGCADSSPDDDSPDSPTADPHVVRRDAGNVGKPPPPPKPPKPERLPPPATLPPTRPGLAQDVELPFYPQAVVARDEATQSQSQSALAVLTTPDPVETVYHWYQQQLGGVKLREDRLVKDSQSPHAALEEQRPDGLRRVEVTREGNHTRIVLLRLRANLRNRK